MIGLLLDGFGDDIKEDIGKGEESKAHGDISEARRGWGRGLGDCLEGMSWYHSFRMIYKEWNHIAWIWLWDIMTTSN